MKAIKIATLFFTIVTSFYTESYAQKTKIFNPKEYIISNRQLAFEDNFDNDKNKWLQSDSTDLSDTPDTAYVSSKETKIAKGYFKYDNQSKSGIFSAGCTTTGIDFNRNFEFEISSLIFYAPDQFEWAGIIFWGRDSAYNTMYFYYNDYKRFSFIDCKNQYNYKSKARHSKDFIKNDFNKITIRHWKDSYYVFINEKFQKAFSFRPLIGNKLGLGAGVGCTMIYDYVKIYYLD